MLPWSRFSIVVNCQVGLSTLYNVKCVQLLLLFDTVPKKNVKPFEKKDKVKLTQYLSVCQSRRD